MIIIITLIILLIFLLSFFRIKKDKREYIQCKYNHIEIGDDIIIMYNDKIFQGKIMNISIRDHPNRLVDMYITFENETTKEYLFCFYDNGLCIQIFRK